jgi:hypothetical protein
MAVREFDDVTSDPDPDSNPESSISDGDAVTSAGVGGGVVASHEDSLSPPTDNPITLPTDNMIPKDVIHPAMDDVMQESSQHPSEADLESWIILQVPHTILFSTHILRQFSTFCTLLHDLTSFRVDLCRSVTLNVLIRDSFV